MYNPYSRAWTSFIYQTRHPLPLSVLLFVSFSLLYLFFLFLIGYILLFINYSSQRRKDAILSVYTLRLWRYRLWWMG